MLKPLVRFLADENFKQPIYRGIRRRVPHIDILRLVDAGLSGAPDPEVLEFAGREDRVLLTHDLATMRIFAAQRLESGAYMAGLIEVPGRLGIHSILDHLEVITYCSSQEEFANRIVCLPLW